MNIPKAFFVVSRYNEPFDWIEKYTPHYIVYNKGDAIALPHVINCKNIGGNQRDILKFICENYNDLPELIAFVQANPFDHCSLEYFDKLIYNDHFTPLEYYGMTPSNNFENRTEDGNFLERNNDWYIFSHNNTYGLSCKYQSFDQFMNTYFENYKHVEWVRFAPGSQYIVERKQILSYPLSFWKYLKEELYLHNMTEGHIIERAMFYILSNVYKIREKYKL